ncbi:MAG: response regulator [Planctomycetes bacterium]|nr:response regulator [Planctomycetota bacterium]
MPRILLVDDDTDVLQSTRELLQEEGYEVLVAEDGAQALAFAERDAPDLVILDIVMPHHNGLSVLQRLRRGSRRPPKIIVLTGNAEPRVRQCAQSAGVDAFVQKPFDIDQLLATVQDLLGQL